MKRVATLVVLFLAGASLVLPISNTYYLTTTRTVPVSSGTAIAFTMGPSLAELAAGAAVSTTVMTLPSTAIATANQYVGLQVDVKTAASSCSTNSGYSGKITAYAANRQATISPASTVAIDPNCTVEVGPALPPDYGDLTIGPCTGICYVSERVGGTGSVDRYVLPAGGSYTWTQNGKSKRPSYVEVLSNSSTDNVTIVVH